MFYRNFIEMLQCINPVHCLDGISVTLGDDSESKIQLGSHIARTDPNMGTCIIV